MSEAVHSGEESHRIHACIGTDMVGVAHRSKPYTIVIKNIVIYEEGGGISLLPVDTREYVRL